MDLIGTMDDATIEMYSAFFLPKAGIASTFRPLPEVFGAHGLPPRLSHDFYPPEAGVKVDRTHPTQVGRVLAHLGVEHIAAYSPEARGRSERLFHTLQDRLAKELALAGIAEAEAANAFMAPGRSWPCASHRPGSNTVEFTRPQLGLTVSALRRCWACSMPR